MDNPESARENPAAQDKRYTRLRGEAALLEALANQNQRRLRDIAWLDTTVTLTLHETPALPVAMPSPAGGEAGPPAPHATHRVRVSYPLFFPTLPLELSLERPVLHPNIHPETGFVCLWHTPRVTDTIEHALHKLVAMLGLHLLNTEPVHLMQPEALQQFGDGVELARLRMILRADPLLGVEHRDGFLAPVVAGPRRQRLWSRVAND